MTTYNYLRVSTEGQDNARQREFFEELRKKDGVDAVFVEEVKSAAENSVRPVWNRVMEDIERGDIVRVSELDRAFRSMREFYGAAEFFRQRGATLKIMKPTVFAVGVTEEGDKINELILYILSWVSERERKMILSRQGEAIALIRQGKQKIRGKQKIIPADLQREIWRDVHERGRTITGTAKTRGVSYGGAYSIVARYKDVEEI
jgi:DNA invertase Pin-like site-specific DNA recombinase